MVPFQIPPAVRSATRRSLLQGVAVLPWMVWDAKAAPMADGYPSRSIKVIVPATAGGIGDLFMRQVTQEISPSLGQATVIDNKPGANSAIGAEAAARAAPDGYTLFLGDQSALVFNSIARKKLPFDAINDFTPIARLFSAPMYLYVNPALGVSTVPELIAYAKARPGKLNFGSTGTASTPHLLAEMFKSSANLDILHVPYKGGPDASSALATGQIDIFFNGANTMAFVKQGKVKVIATCGLKRSETQPTLPTVAESGLPGFEVVPWFALFGPANLPRPIVDYLQYEYLTLLQTPGMKDRANQAGLEVTTSTAAELGARLKAEFALMTPIMRRAGIQGD